MKKILYLMLALLISLGVFFFETGTREVSKSHALCDGFFVGAVILFSTAGISFVIDSGGFDTLAFAGKKIFSKFKREKKEETFLEYSEEKSAEREEKNKLTPKKYKLIFLIASGTFMLILSLIMLFVS